MNRSTQMIARLLALTALAAGTAAAQTDGAARPARPSLDANQDGVIDRTEAAASPRLAAKFDQLDANKDGRLTQDELPARGGRHGEGRGRHHAGIAALDTDGDGRISRQEAAGKGRLAEGFDAIDVNKDGYIVRSELRAYVARQRPVREAEMRKRMDAMFSAADLNKDGKLSRVEVAEKMPRLAKHFAWNDDNKDGFLSKSELEAGLADRLRR